MKSTLLSFVLIFLHLGTCDAVEVKLSNDDSRVVSLPVNGSVAIVATGHLAHVASILCQAHTQTGNITLSSKPVVAYETAVNGQDVGMITVLESWSSNITWFLYSNSSYTFKVLLHLKYLINDDPLIGGCNEEFKLKNDPNIHLHVKPTKATVQFQWSNTGRNPATGTFPTCEDSTFQSYLGYDVYAHFLQADDFSEDSYFDGLKQVITAERLVKHGTKIKTLANSESQKSYVDITSYNARGAIYSVIVNVNNKKRGVVSMATYIPVVSYGCNIRHKDTCKQRNAVSMVFCTAGGILGLFVCFFGHRFFKTVNFLFGFLIFSLIFYQIFALETHINYTGAISLAAIFGLIGGALLLGLWWYGGIPVLNVLVIGLVSGYILTSIVFYTPAGNIYYLTTPFNYGAMFACGVLIIPVLLLCFTRFLSIFTCALTGSFAFVIMLDFYMNSGLHYIVLNSLRHGTDKSFVHVLVTQPFTHHEIALTVVWIVVLILGVVFQMLRERKKAPFPPCPRQVQDRDRDLRSLLRAKQDSPDREPLLRGGYSRQYGAIGSQDVSEPEEESEEEINRPRMV